MSTHSPSSLLRDITIGHQRVSPIELFFDLVFVFAITQLSHTLLEHLDRRGAFETLLLLVAVWLTWIYGVWMTNWLDPDKRPVRLALIALMLVGLIMSTSIARAFDDRGLVFAGAFVATQVGRSLFLHVAFRDVPRQRLNFLRVIIWQVAAGIFWIAGGVAEGVDRDQLWLTAIAIELAGPAVGFFVPGLGRSHTRDWVIVGDHFAERCELFIIIALGESILVTGATVSELDLNSWTLVATIVAFTGSVAFWWVYFDRGARVISDVLSRAEDKGRLARSAYVYFHLPIVAGIIITAVGDELTIAHPTGHTDLATAAVVLGGPALFLVGHTLVKWAIFRVVSLSRVVGIALLAALIPVATFASPVALATLATTVVIAIGIADVSHYRVIETASDPAIAHD
jgi:low temperature requirement protein LtrA